jgi:transcriptional regulator with XRE-family HTH domain
MRRLRAVRGLSQEALAHECGINRTYLSAIEGAERNVSIDNIARIAKELNSLAPRAFHHLVNGLGNTSAPINCLLVKVSRTNPHVALGSRSSKV